MARQVSVKHLQIDKARSNVLAIIAIAVIIIVFCLMSTKALLGQAAYQRRVINARHAGLQQLQANVTAAKQLVTEYNQVFEGSSPTNLIGGQNTKDTNAVPPNGDNARIILDALPSKYDYPALLTSINYILTKDGAQSVSITGNDESATANNDPTTNPQPVPISLTVSGSDSYSGVQTIVRDFERSVRPFNVSGMQLTGGESNMNFSIDVTTYYQPAKSLDLTTKGIK